MNILLTYSSLTGNTRKVAEAMAQVLPGTEAVSIRQAPDPAAFDLIAHGFWVRKGKPDRASLTWLAKIHGRGVLLFGTLGAWPDSDHARRCADYAAAMLTQNGNRVLGVFLCQGKVNPGLRERLPVRVRQTHPMTPERLQRHAEAARHPDKADMDRARAFAMGCLAQFTGK